MTSELTEVRSERFAGGREQGWIELRGLTKAYGTRRVVDAVDAVVGPGRVTGFLGPNGAGKTTTIKMILGLARPTAGSALVGGKPYTSLRRPATVVGAAIESARFANGRSGRNHLRVMAVAAEAPIVRVDEVLEQVGLADARDMPVGRYSLGMKQRLSLATCLLGDPEVLILDEPTNGLDPAGIAWLRQLLRAYAAAGKTIFISSHMLSEVSQSVDDVLVIRSGRLAYSGELATLTKGASSRVQLRLERSASGIARQLLGPQADVRLSDDAQAEIWTVNSRDAATGVRELARQKLLLVDPVERESSLEEAFLDLVGRDAGETAR